MVNEMISGYAATLFERGALFAVLRLQGPFAVYCACAAMVSTWQEGLW